MEMVKKVSNFKYIFEGIIISILITMILLFVLSAVMTYTDVNENIIKPSVIIITGVSILIGSSISSLKIKKRGILNGAIIGFSYLLIIYILSSAISSSFLFNLESIITIIIGMVLGILGGILGVNKK